MLCVPRHVSVKFGLPIARIGNGFMTSAASATMLVPEAAMNKDYLFPVAKNDVRFSGEFFRMETIAIAHGE